MKIVLVGDSTVNDEGGWGPGFKASFGPGVEIINLAKNGRSSKSFRDEGLWAPALAAKPDFILIQFGHNDVPGKGADRETDAKTTYRQNLSRYLEEARSVGAQPILVTSIVRRNFTPEGQIVVDSLSPYVEQVRALAAEKRVPLIDLYSFTKEQAEELGPRGCEEIDAVDKDGKPDHTHLGPKGRQEIGAMAARELVRLESVLASKVVTPGRR
ncbi:MAG TPA: rhamnogalacturonan acetylesterase [Bryobacteraceae bacterium]|nr:rhamnogalacturonan acetylesterase [Bryobacteraceae bacterium]